MFVVDFTDFCTLTYGQIEHGLLHLNIPFLTLVGLLLGGGGTLALMSLSLMFIDLLYAIRGGFGKIVFICGSVVIALQCL